MCDAPPFGALAAVGTEVGGVTHTGSQVCDYSHKAIEALFQKVLRSDPELII
jgi:hypothetical protein